MQWEDRIGRRLKLRDLHTLQVVSEIGSMAKASRQLGLSQPAISKAIAEMEQALGTPLLERSLCGCRAHAQREPFGGPGSGDLRRGAARGEGHRAPVRPDARRGTNRRHRTVDRHFGGDHQPVVAQVSQYHLQHHHQRHDLPHARAARAQSRRRRDALERTQRRRRSCGRSCSTTIPSAYWCTVGIRCCATSDWS